MNTHRAIPRVLLLTAILCLLAAAAYAERAVKFEVEIDGQPIESFCHWHPSDTMCGDTPPPVDVCIEDPEADGCPCPDSAGHVYPDCPVVPPIDPVDPCIEDPETDGCPCPMTRAFYPNCPVVPPGDWPLVVTKDMGSATVSVQVVEQYGTPVLKMAMRGLEHKNEMAMYINGTRYTPPDARWDGPQSTVKTAYDSLPKGMLRNGTNTVRWDYEGSSRDTTRSFTIEGMVLEFDPALPMPPDPATVLGVVAPSQWNPRDVKQITNPNPADHPLFTSLLSRPDLVWADSLRPYGDEKLLHDYYDGQRRNAGSDKPLSNPRMSYDHDKQASRLDFVVGELGQLGTYQTRINWPSFGPDDGDMVTVQWEMLIYKDDIRGGKQFQIAAADSLHYEYNAYYKTGQSGVAGGWASVPVVRVYSAQYIGEKGLGDRLVSDRPEGCAGVNRCASQPALPFGAPKSAGVSSFYELDDHITYPGGTAYMVGDEDLSGWVTVTVTFDWRDPANHKVWQFISDERTPTTLVIGTDTDGDGYGDDGYKLGYGGKSAINSFWLEFNNSSTVNSSPSHVWVRNVVVVGGMIIPLEETN